MRWYPWMVVALWCLGAAGGCVQMIRRPTEGQGRPWAGLPGEDAREERTIPAPGSGENREYPASEAGPDGVGPINEYALWCVQHGMWKEAQLHLERALACDSSSASLYNNLAIVYEHLGRVDSAAVLYRRALELDGRETRYRTNLERLERSRTVNPDTAQAIDLFELKKRTPGPQQAPY